MSVYMIPIDEHGYNALTRKKDEEFTITDLEVWQVEFSPEFNKREYLLKLQQIREDNFKKFKYHKDYEVRIKKIRESLK